MKIKSLFRVLPPPATPEQISALLVSTGGELPSSYIEFLLVSNGPESCINDQGGDCLAFYHAAEVQEMNKAYQIARWMPEYLAIGSNGGGHAVGLDRRESAIPDEWPVVKVAFGNLGWEDSKRLATSFREWQQGGFKLRSSDAPSSPHP